MVSSQLWMEIKVNFFKIGGDVSDGEWEEFYTEFITPFVACDVDLSYMISTVELTACFTTVLTSKILELAGSFTGKEADVLKYMDIEAAGGLTLYDYIFLRKVVSAMKTCADAGYFSPNRLYCGLSITSPRSPAITSAVEKEVFNAAIVLTDGFYYG